MKACRCLAVKHAALDRTSRMKIKAVEVCIITEKVPAVFLCFTNNYIAFSVASATIDLTYLAGSGSR